MGIQIYFQYMEVVSLSEIFGGKNFKTCILKTKTYILFILSYTV